MSIAHEHHSCSVHPIADDKPDPLAAKGRGRRVVVLRLPLLKAAKSESLHHRAAAAATQLSRGELATSEPTRMMLG